MDKRLKIQQTNNVWRYMGLSKFVWMLQNESLWLSRSDLMGDPWEVNLAGKQLQLVKDRHPPTNLNNLQAETSVERSERIINNWRKNTFVNCWNMSKHESNALWQIYCKTPEGIVIQTNYEKLNLVKNNYSLQPVEYIVPGSNMVTPTHSDLVTKKRPEFSYEEEIRIFHFDKINEYNSAKGIGLKVDIVNFIESIKVHPEADQVFFNIIKSLIEQYLPDFKGSLAWSDMRVPPPF
jgi:hypothetical protein